MKKTNAVVGREGEYRSCGREGGRIQKMRMVGMVKTEGVIRS